MKQQILLPIMISCLVFAGLPQTKPVKLPFWAKRGAKGDPRVVSIQPHELCSGDIAECKVSEIPEPIRDKALEPALAFELSAKGEIINQWAIPIEYLIVAVRGDNLILAPSWKPESKIVVVVTPAQKVWLEKIKDPFPKGRSPQTNFGSCNKALEGRDVLSFTDLMNKKPRVIAFVEPCT